MAAVTLWVCTVYLYKEHRCYWLTLIPAIFMTVVVSDFLLVSPTTFGLPYTPSLIVAIAIALAALARFIWWARYARK